MFPKREEPVLLVMDGYGLHLCYPFLELCCDNNTHVILHVPHTSHKTQGEDLVNYMVFKSQFHRRKAVVLSEKISKLGRIVGLHRTDLLDCIKDPWEKAFSFENNMSGWSKEGIIPFTRAPYHEALAQERKLEFEKHNMVPGNFTEHVKEKLATVFMDCDEADEYDNMSHDELVKLLIATKAELREKTNKKTRLTSSTLFNTKGGVTADEALAIVKNKDDERKRRQTEQQNRREKKDAIP